MERSTSKFEKQQLSLLTRIILEVNKQRRGLKSNEKPQYFKFNINLKLLLSIVSGDFGKHLLSYTLLVRSYNTRLYVAPPNLYHLSRSLPDLWARLVLSTVHNIVQDKIESRSLNARLPRHWPLGTGQEEQMVMMRLLVAINPTLDGSSFQLSKFLNIS